VEKKENSEQIRRVTRDGSERGKGKAKDGGGDRRDKGRERG